MTVLERRFDDAGSAAVAGRPCDKPDAAEASTARRIRLGLTGLATIFLLVMIAAVAFRPAAPPVAAAPEAQAEPLAVLGVAPGAVPAAEDAAAAPAQITAQAGP